jgi:hypothetical protein
VAPIGSASIDLPWLPPQGVVVERNGGIVFVAMDGKFRAELRGFELINPTGARRRAVHGGNEVRARRRRVDASGGRG